jgi:hypothetical protein
MVIVIRLVIDFGELVKVALKGGVGKGLGGCGKRYGSCWVSCPCVCLGVFLLLSWKVLVSGIAGGWACVQLVQ